MPLNARTRNMMGAREFAMMKDSAILINTCRGPVVDETALYQALTTRQIAAAGLDVMVEEPPKSPTIRSSSSTTSRSRRTWRAPRSENWTKAFRNGFDNIQRVAAGGRPLWVIPELRE